MASIETSSIEVTGFRARLTGLDTSYSGTDRVAWWELYDTSTGTQVANPSQNLGANISNGPYQQFSGLTADTTYRLYCYIYYSGGSSTLGPVSVKTGLPDTTDMTLTLTVMSHSSIKATFTYDKYFPYYKVQWRKYGTSSWTSNSSSFTKMSATKSYTITGLDANTKYQVRIQVSDTSSGTYTTSTSTKTATTDSLPDPTTTLTLTTLSHSSIRARFTYDSNYPYYKVQWKKSSASSWSSNSSSFTSYSATKTYTITGLSPSTTYDVRVLITDTSDGEGYWWTDTVSATTSAYPDASVTLTLTTLSTDSIQAQFTYDSDYPYYKVQWKKSTDSSWTVNSSSYTNYSSTTTYTITGLSENTTYNVRILLANNSSGTYTDYSSTQSATTLAYPTVYISDVTVLSYNAISTTFTYDSNYPYYRVRWKPASSSSWTYNSSSYLSYSSSNTYTITGLSASTAYDIEILVATDSSGSNATTVSMDSSVTTLPQPTANINITTIGETSVSGTITIDSNYRYIQTKYKKVSDSTYTYYPSTLTQRTESSWAFTITGLQEDTDYSLNGLVSATGDTSYSYNILSSDISFHTLAPVTIEPWSWTSANSSVNPSHTAEATASQTTAARDACQNKTAISNFKYQVWNDLVYKVSEARVAGDNTSWNNNYATLSNTLMTSSDRVLTATRYNSLRYNIDSVYSVPSEYKISEVHTGDVVYGTAHFLNFITYYLNAYINTLL